MKNTILFLFLSISVYAQNSEVNKRLIKIEDRELREALSHCANDYNKGTSLTWSLFSVFVSPQPDNSLELIVKGFYSTDTTKLRVPNCYTLLDNTVYFFYTGESLFSKNADKAYEQHIRILFRERMDKFDEEIRNRRSVSIANDEKYFKSMIDSTIAAVREKDRLKNKSSDATNKDEWENVGVLEIPAIIHHTSRLPSYKVIFRKNSTQIFSIQEQWVVE
jgi:hypothetical protein